MWVRFPPGINFDPQLFLDLEAAIERTKKTVPA
jgi:hypothetical protein